MLNTCGIYLITNMSNGMVYVGKSQGVKERLREHRTKLRGVLNITRVSLRLEVLRNEYGINTEEKYIQ